MLKDVQFSSVCQVGFLGLGEESSHELYFYLVSLAFKKNITLFISLKAMGLSPRHLPGCFFLWQFALLYSDFGYYRKENSSECVEQPDLKGKVLEFCLHGTEEELQTNG